MREQMSFLDFGKPKCMICGKRDNSLDSVSGYGIYQNSKQYFHRSCLRDITCDPEHYKHTQVDMAITIIEQIEKEKKRAISRKELNKAKCEKLSNYCIDDKTLF